MSGIRFKWTYYRRKRSLRRLCFYTCLSVILFTRRGVCLSAWWDSRPPQERAPPRSRHPPPWNRQPSAAATPPPHRAASLPPSRHPPEQTPPPRTACWEIRATSGRYTVLLECIFVYINIYPRCLFLRKTRMHSSRMRTARGCLPKGASTTPPILLGSTYPSPAPLHAGIHRPLWTDTHTPVKTLPFLNNCCGR